MKKITAIIESTKALNIPIGVKCNIILDKFGFVHFVKLLPLGFCFVIETLEEKKSTKWKEIK